VGSVFGAATTVVGGWKMSLDERLFRSTWNNPHHTLHALLPPQLTTSQNYQLRQRVHDRQLPVHLGHLIDKNFITRSLYKDMY